MFRSALAMALLALGTATFAQEPAPKPTDTPSSSLADKVKENPNDTTALNGYFSETFRAISTLVRTDVDGAEKKLSELKQQIDAMAPTKAEAKALLERGKAALKFYEERVAVARVKLTELVDKLKANSDDTDALSKYSTKVVQEISLVLRSAPDQARKDLASAREFLTELKAKAKAETSAKIDQTLRNLSSMESSLDAEKTREKLVGQKAAPLDVEAWVNGSPVTDEDLKGKVVLLDFWAVWCGPCIATFPHLREWNEKYADKGLVILGLTKYYNYDWDEKTDKATSSKEKVAPEKEQAMLVKFAAQHKLTHRFGVQRGNTLAKFYGVTGIPQAVVIDRDGIVRLIRVGSGDANSKAIGDLLEKLLEQRQNAGE